MCGCVREEQRNDTGRYGAVRGGTGRGREVAGGLREAGGRLRGNEDFGEVERNERKDVGISIFFYYFREKK